MRKTIPYLICVLILLSTFLIKPMNAEAKNDCCYFIEYNPNEQVGFNDDHYIIFMPSSGNLSGNCLSFAYEIKWSLRTISYDLFMAGPYMDNLTNPDYIHSWDDDWEFTKGSIEHKLFLPDFASLFVLNRTVKESGFYWFIIYVWEHPEDERTSFSDYMILLTNYYYEWDGSKCYLNSNIPILGLVSLGGLLVIIKRKKTKRRI
jgi:hypothetical protein